MDHKITCRQAVNFIGRREEHQLTQKQRFALWRHLGDCSLCRNFLHQDNLIGKVAGSTPSPGVSLSASEKKQIKDAALRSGENG